MEQAFKQMHNITPSKLLFGVIGAQVEDIIDESVNAIVDGATTVRNFIHNIK